MTPAFNLLDEPWIPVRTPTGEVRDINLSEALLKARDYTALAETSPPNLIALHRLLLAVLHRALTTHHGKWNDQDRARWFREGLPEAPIRAYLAQWRERFWLFHPSEPFMQVVALATETETKDAVFPSSTLCLNQFYGPPMFDHGIYDQRERPATSVLRDMLGYMQFVPGGFFPGKKLRGSDKAGALANTAAVMPLGACLAETLLLGLHPYGGEQDLPCWERPQPSIAALCADPKLASGPNDRYVRQTRAVLLEVGSSSEKIGRLWMAAGIALADDPTAPDPMSCQRINRNGEAIRISYGEGRAFWRDLPSLVPDPGNSHDHPPAILGWATNLYDACADFDAQVNILSAGLASDQAKLLRWRLERIELPQTLLTQPDAAAYLRVQVRFAEDVHYRTREVFSELIAQSMPNPKHKDTDTRSRARNILDNGPSAPVFFAAAEQALPHLMRQIAEGDIDAADRDWKATLMAAANQSWTATRRSLGDSPAVLRADARTWPRFRGLLKTLVQPEAAATESTTTTSEEVPA